MSLDQFSRIRILRGHQVYFDNTLQGLVLQLCVAHRQWPAFPVTLEIDGQPVTIEAPPDPECGDSDRGDDS